MKDIVIKKLFEYTLDTCKNWKEKDQYGNEITMEYIRKYFDIFKIELYDEESFSMICNLMSDISEECMLGNHFIEAYVNNKDNDIHCTLVG